MPIPERRYSEEFFEVDPPVIPVKFTLPVGRGVRNTTSMKGFQGFKLIQVGGAWRCLVTDDFTLKILSDGYAEVPATNYNKEKLKNLSKPKLEKATYDRGVTVDVDDPEKVWFVNRDGEKKILTQEALDKGEIRKIAREYETPAVVKSLKSKRVFDMKTKESNEAQQVRPWLLQFVSVDSAIMEAPVI